MAPHSFRKPSGQRYYYYRCVKRWQERACEHGKTHGAEELEARMWELVREMLKHPEQLHADLDAMIEQERKAGRRGNPEREAEAWLEKLAEVDRKRSAYQDQQVEGLITLDELRTKLVALEETRKTAQKELETVRNREEHIAQLEADRDWLLEYYTMMAPVALDCLAPEERRRLYGMLRLELTLAPDGSAELHGVAFAEEDLVSVCDTDTTHPSRAGPSWSAGRRVTAACCRASSPSSTSARSLPDDGITALLTLCRPPTALPPTGRFELLPPPAAPPRFRGTGHLPFGEFFGDEDASVAFYVAEPGIAQGVGRHPGGQIQDAPQPDHLRRRPEAGRTSILPPEPLPRSPASPAQLVGGEPLLRGVPGQFIWKPVPVVRSQPLGLLSSVSRGRA